MTDLYQIDGTKIQFAPQRVAQWLDAGDDWEKLKKVAPIYVEISPVGACNHRCKFCSVDYIGYQRRSLDYARLSIAIADMARHGVKSIMFAGEGEPLLHRDIGDLINHTKSCGIDVAVTTNATGLTEHLVQQCLHSVTWLKASVNGGTPEAYAKVHQTKEKDFARVIGNLAKAAKLRRASRDFLYIDQGGQPIECTLGAQIVLLPENAHTVVNLATICRDIGLDYLVIKPYSQNPNSTGTLERGYDKFDYQATGDLAARLEEFNTDSFQVVYREKTMANLTHEREYETCHSTPHFWCYVMASGECYACSAHLLNEQFCLGNINEQSFSEIWEGEKRRKLIHTMRNGFDLSVCRKNCRMEAPNKFLWQLQNPGPHANFI